MNIPTKDGEYTFNINGHKVNVLINRYTSLRNSKMERITGDNSQFHSKIQVDGKTFAENSFVTDYVKSMNELMGQLNKKQIDPNEVISEIAGIFGFFNDAKVTAVKDKYITVKVITDGFQLDERIKKLEENGFQVKKLKGDGWHDIISVKKPLNDNNQDNLTTESYMRKKLIKLTESDLHNIITESVNKIINEGEAMFVAEPSATDFTDEE